MSSLGLGFLNAKLIIKMGYFYFIKQESAPKRIGKFILVNILIALGLVVFFCPKCFLSLRGLKLIYPDFIFSFFMSSSLAFGGLVVEAYFNKKISWVNFPVKRLLLTLLIYLTYSFVVSYLISVIGYLIMFQEITLDNIDWVAMMDETIFPIGVALVLISLFTARSWLYEWRNAAIEAEQLRTEKLAGQYQSLKNQLNPHFLFNSLNVLTNLVYEDADKSASFIQQLSRIYRYVLDVQQEELVSLSDEIGFAQNYLSLQKLRFEENLIYEIKIDRIDNLYLPPLSLQLLLENAIKHNIVSMEHPLKISIYQRQDMLIVSNNFQPKKLETIDSKGIGLENIRKRYELLSDRQLEIIKAEAEFCVKLPLLTLAK
ncbi:Histidine kinase [Marivirga sericea]|uniref:Histidine kinase n=1 Tax=Marivirga sericea TaxID=1028 RepID=A0A1X7L4X7_9BACT|nr:histidine kinase [Marivirga sericea]SMG48785.1 Histidine kinase [Marivirga sericea]